jgi:hypothetical protein
MKSKDLALRIAGAIFGIVAVLHLLRLITGVTVMIGDWTLPMWVNMLGLIGAAVLCFWLLFMSGKQEE